MIAQSREGEAEADRLSAKFIGIRERAKARGIDPIEVLVHDMRAARASRR
jgi:hypothetical protein